ncbi:MAG: hypothetical protein ACRDO9_05735, partial [Gaiellales bacterium]
LRVGFVLPRGGLVEASTARSGIVRRIDAESDQRLRAGDVAAELKASGGSEFSVVAPTGGPIGEMLAASARFPFRTPASSRS